MAEFVHCPDAGVLLDAVTPQRLDIPADRAEAGFVVGQAADEPGTAVADTAALDPVGVLGTAVVDSFR